MNTAHVSFARSMELLEGVPPRDVPEHLSRIARESRIFAIFREIFPEEFAALGRDAIAVRGETRRGIVTFCELVYDRLFPIGVDHIEECGLGGIPFLTFIDHENDFYDPWDLPSAIRLALYLNPEYVDEPASLLAMFDLDDRAASRVPAAVDAGSLVYGIDAALAQAPRALRRLGTIALIPGRDTGNVFYDGSCMCGGCDAVDWTLEHVQLLAEHYREACAIDQAIGDLSAWLDRDPSTRIARAVRLWNRAVERERSRNAEAPIPAA